METYILEGLSERERIVAVLSQRLPHLVEPWTFKDEGGVVLAFLDVVEANGAVSIVANLSGAHPSQSEKVIELLSELQVLLGGRVIDPEDDDLV